MNDDVRNIVLGLVASALSAALGWIVRTALWRRALRRKQRFFGLPEGSECLLVVNRDPASSQWSVARDDTFALLELAALIRECGARADIIPHDTDRRGFGTRTEFCLGGPVSNQRTAAHLHTMLPGVRFDTAAVERTEPPPLSVGGETYRLEKGEAEYVVLARLAPAGDSGNDRPVFLAAGQRGVTNQAAVRYLVRHQGRLARKHGARGTFCLLLKVVNSGAYGPDVVELVADVTRAATTQPAPQPAPDTEPAAG